MRFQVRFHWQMTYVIPTSSAHHLHTCLSCPISCSTTPGVICMSSAHHPQTHMSPAHCPHIVHRWVCHLHVVCTSSSGGYVICMSSAGMYVIHTSSAGTYVICTSSAELLMVSVDHNYLSTATGTGY